MADEITQSDIVDAATGPARVTGDEGTVQERTSQELIAADRYNEAKGVNKPPHGLHVSRIRYPSALGTSIGVLTFLLLVAL